MTEEPTRPSRLRLWPILALAAVLGAAAGAGAVYVKGSAERNAQDATCAAKPALMAALKPLAKGEVAAVAVPDRPRPLPALSFLKHGQPFSSANFAGKTVLLNVWATWCVPCRQEMPALDALQAKLGSENFEVVAVSVDLKGEEKARAFLAEIGVTHLAHYASPNGDLLEALKKVGRAVGLPTSILINRDGCELGYLPGPADWASADAEAFIRAAVAGE